MRILKISAALALSLASTKSAAVTASAALTTSAAVATVSADQGSSIAVERAQQTPSAGHIGSVIASFAHRVACSKGGLFNAFCDHSQTAAPHLRRNEIIGHAMQTTTSWTTIESTSTVGSTTTTIYMAPSDTNPTTDSMGWLKFAVETEHTSSTATDSTNGINVVETTVVKTITIRASKTSLTTTNASPAVSTARETSPTTTGTTAPASTARETCSNNTSIDTQVYINISTFSIPSLTHAPKSTSPSLSPFFTACNSSEVSMSASGSLTSRTANSMVTASTTSGAASTDNLRGFTGAVTSTLGSASSESINVHGIHVPAGMVAAMAACFLMALLL